MPEVSHAPRISEILAGIASAKRKTVSVRDVLEAFGDRAFGALMFVFAAPVALPMPPGVSAILGAPLLFIAAQLMVGRRTLWLPSFLADRTMSRADFAGLMEKLSPYLSWIERRLRPRLTFLYNRWLDGLTGFICLVLAIIVFLPIPFGNMLPALAIAAFGLGIAERDGLLGAFGGLIAAISIGVLAFLSSAIIAGIMAFTLAVVERLT
ncbi:exopolysaccharide biosynthesis protein [Caulobacter mirabilis]|uniref:Exopolysaccharide biosynthesis protein n=1 Tax=Caulobacter mirabilis TaxID=69666 RepID=A0A2D2B047_9CAUL|nr:exopolysaccharide biosynthesis protein [Caulobacter mirabilis]ATQ43632.1 exopolysaccharide biosynthesis protein [Caulobacter mirabilis]